MYGLAVNLSMTLSGHPWIINEILNLMNSDFYCIRNQKGTIVGQATPLFE